MTTTAVDVDISEYKVGLVVECQEIAGKTSKSGKALKLCQVDVGNSEKIPVVTNAPNVRLESRVVVALAGSSVVNDGELLEIKPTNVGGFLSKGMLCDSKMLGWTGGAAGVAVNLPDSFAVGSAPPAAKPRPQGAASEETAVEQGPVTGGLFERKLTKEEKKKLAAEKRAAKKAAKEAKKTEE